MVLEHCNAPLPLSIILNFNGALHLLRLLANLEDPLCSLHHFFAPWETDIAYLHFPPICQESGRRKRPSMLLIIDGARGGEGGQIPPEKQTIKSPPYPTAGHPCGYLKKRQSSYSQYKEPAGPQVLCFHLLSFEENIPLFHFQKSIIWDFHLLTPNALFPLSSLPACLLLLLLPLLLIKTVIFS